MPNSERVLFVVPCYNEAGSIAAVISDLQRHFPRGDVLVIDDGSKDDTAKEAAKLASVVKLPVNLGIGGAVQTGIRYASRFGYDFCFQIDGDGQHPASEVEKFFNHYREEPANLIVGSRFVSATDGFRSTALRRVGIFVIRTLVRWVTGRRIMDPTSGFRMLDRKAMAVFSEDYSLDYPEPIALAIASSSGLSIREIPVTMRERQAGVSSISGLKNLAYMIRVSCYLLAVRLRRVL